jgi:hypothetical protein
LCQGLLLILLLNHSDKKVDWSSFTW